MLPRRSIGSDNRLLQVVVKSNRVKYVAESNEFYAVPMCICKSTGSCMMSSRARIETEE
jgi:hypothetical protein